MGNIFQKIMQLNIRDVWSRDLVTYIKLKFQQAVEITDKNDYECFVVRNKELNSKKEVKINTVKNLEKAFQNSANLTRNRASDVFLQMEAQL